MESNTTFTSIYKNMLEKRKEYTKEKEEDIARRMQILKPLIEEGEDSYATKARSGKKSQKLDFELDF